MPLTKYRLDLADNPTSVKEARRWVVSALNEIGRDDLVESATLSVSELVTNALIHADPPLRILLRGTVEHPRIEIHDGSEVPPRRNPIAPTPDDLSAVNLTTFGRGLSLVAMCSHRWGATLDLDRDGKSVWFEPAADPVDEPDCDGDVFAAPPPALHDREDLEGTHFLIEIRGLDPRLFAQLRAYHFEVRREMRLMSLANPGKVPLAEEIHAVFAQGDSERRNSQGIDRLDTAIATKREAPIDLIVVAPVTTPSTFEKMTALLSQLQEVFSEGQLLAVAPPQEILDLQDWYFGEFVGQSQGRQPVSWPEARRMADALGDR